MVSAKEYDEHATRAYYDEFSMPTRSSDARTGPPDTTRSSTI